MTIKYLDAKRIRGTATERTALSGATAPPQTSWKEIGRSTLTSAGDVLDSGTITAKDNLMILVIGYKSGSASTEKLQFNADTGSNYSERHAENQTALGTNTSQDHIELSISGSADEFTVLQVRNIAGREKLVTGHTVSNNAAGTGSGTAPKRWEIVGKWANTSNQITRVQVTNPYGGDLDTGSELIVLGCDDDEADSGTNFWQELLDTELTTNSTGNAFTTDTFATKKYLMMEFFINASTDPTYQFGTGGTIDGGSNYSVRWGNNGASDQTIDGYSAFLFPSPVVLTNIYIINKSDKEKLCMQDGTAIQSAGAGSPPNRQEFFGKWVNTSGQINIMKFLKGSVTFYTGTRIRVWGHD